VADALFTAEAEALQGLPGFSRDWEQELRRGSQLKTVLDGISRERIAQEESRVKRNAVDGVGELVMRVPLGDYLWAIQRWGPECWADSDFKRSVIKKNPEVRVRSGGTGKIMSGYRK
jgi:hypothetical protein